MTRLSSFLFNLIILLSTYYGNAFSLECPKAPEQISKDWESEFNATVAKIGPVKGSELKTKAKKTTQDLLSKFPNADKLYFEQMMLSTYCSALRDDKKITETEKGRRLKIYIDGVRETIAQQPQKKKSQRKLSTPNSPVVKTINKSPQVVQIIGDLNINTERRMNDSTAADIMRTALKSSPYTIIIELIKPGGSESLAYDLLNIAKQAGCKSGNDLLNIKQEGCKVDVVYNLTDPSFTGVQVRYLPADINPEVIKGITSALKAGKLQYTELTEGLGPDHQPKTIYLSISFHP